MTATSSLPEITSVLVNSFTYQACHFLPPRAHTPLGPPVLWSGVAVLDKAVCGLCPLTIPPLASFAFGSLVGQPEIALCLSLWGPHA